MFIIHRWQSENPYLLKKLIALISSISQGPRIKGQYKLMFGNWKTIPLTIVSRCEVFKIHLRMTKFTKHYWDHCSKSKDLIF